MHNRNSTHRKSFHKRCLTALFAFQMCLLSANTPAAPIDFFEVPTANTCPYPWVITMLPPGVFIAPQDSKVLNLRATSFVTPQGFQYVSPVSAAFHPGYLCFFEACTPANITLVCAPIAAKRTLDLNEEQRIVLKEIDGK